MEKVIELINFFNYLKLYIEEKFIIDNGKYFALTFTSIVNQRRIMKSRALRKMKKVQRKTNTMEKKMINDGNKKKENDKKKVKDDKSNSKANMRSFIVRQNRLEKEHHDVYHDNEFSATGIPLPRSFFEMTPRLICFLIVKLGIFSILALPLMQVLLIVFAPFWVMVGIFLLPPLLIAYITLCLMWSIAPFYVKNFDIDCGYSVNGLENNYIIS